MPELHNALPVDHPHNVELLRTLDSDVVEAYYNDLEILPHRLGEEELVVLFI